MNETQPISPLAVIAIFAGIIEASALASLPFLSERSQTIYTWFLVGFPFFLTLLFFLTLNFNYRSLYSPEAHAERQGRKSGAPAAHAQAHDRQPDVEATAEAQILVVSGPQARDTVEQHLIQVSNTLPSVRRHWIIYDLNRRLRLHVTLEPLPAGQEPLVPSA